MFNDHGIKIISAISEEAQSTIPEVTRDSEQSSLLLEAPDIEAM